MMHLLLGVRKNSDGARMLCLILHRYGLYNEYRMEYCYESLPPSKMKDRTAQLAAARARLEKVWLDQPGVIIGFGWMACELLTGKGKTKLKDKVGTRWIYAGGIVSSVWITYDPDSCLYDPGVVVDISAVLVAAGREEGLSMSVVKNETLHQMNNIWKRYL